MSTLDVFHNRNQIGPVSFDIVFALHLTMALLGSKHILMNGEEYIF